MIPLFAPDLGPDEQLALNQCIESGWISSASPQVGELEQALSSLTGSPHVIAVQSGTAALHLALLAHDIGPGDEVLVPDLSFIATANVVRYVGASPVLVDVDADTWQMDLELATQYLDTQPHRVKAILLVHVLGYAANALQWQHLAQRHNLPLIEDAAGAIGTTLSGQQVGTFGACGILSFNGNKLVTTGGGGAVLCKQPHVAARIRHLANQAKTPGPGYDHDQVGYNYRMSGLAAALGLAQLKRLPAFLQQHEQLFHFYQALFPAARFPLAIPSSSPNHWLLTAKFQDRSSIQARADQAGIQTRVFWTPIHLQVPYQSCRFLANQTQTSEGERIWQQALSLPSGSGLTKADIATIGEVFRGSR